VSDFPRARAIYSKSKGANLTSRALGEAGAEVERSGGRSRTGPSSSPPAGPPPHRPRALLLTARGPSSSPPAGPPPHRPRALLLTARGPSSSPPAGPPPHRPRALLLTVRGPPRAPVLTAVWTGPRGSCGRALEAPRPHRPHRRGTRALEDVLTVAGRTRALGEAEAADARAGLRGEAGQADAALPDDEPVAPCAHARAQASMPIWAYGGVAGRRGRLPIDAPRGIDAASGGIWGDEGIEPIEGPQRG
jgi:hypothetical protein